MADHYTGPEQRLLIQDLADEIERLLDDMREWASQNTRNGNLAGTEFVNAYEKDMK